MSQYGLRESLVVWSWGLWETGPRGHQQTTASQGLGGGGGGGGGGEEGGGGGGEIEEGKRKIETKGDTKAV